MSNPEYDIPQTTLERVRKLLAKAEGTDNEHERETFMSAAASLMAKYGIEQAMLGQGQARVTPGNRVVHVEEGSYMARHLDLIYHIAEAMGCKSIMLHPRSARNETNRKAVHIFGYLSDIERAEVMYTSLLLQMASTLRRLVVPAGHNTRSYRNSWCHGYVAKVVDMVKAREQAAAQEAGSSTALVLVDRSSAVRLAFQEEYATVRKSYARTTGRGYSAGQAAGARANLGGTGLGGNRRSLTG